MEIVLHHCGSARFRAEARQHKIVVDQPPPDGAADKGMTPAELLLASLGGCVGQYVAQYLSLRGLSSEGLQVRVEAQPATRPLRLKEFRVEVVVPGADDRQLKTLEKSFPAGLVQNAVALANSLRITASSAREDEVTR